MPKLTRRTFIKVTGVTAASVAAATGTRALLESGGQPATARRQSAPPRRR